MTGGRLPTAVVIVTVSAALATPWLSVTTSWAMYLPGCSGTNDGVAVSPDRIAALFAGRRMKDHWKWNASPSGSLDRLPSRTAGTYALAAKSDPASAAGGRFGGAA